MLFIEARNFTRVGSPARKIDVVVVHTMEAPEKPDTAENVARWFAGSSAPKASAHYCVDANSIVQCVRDEDVAWAAPGCNHNGLQIEHAGYARQGRAGWADAYSQNMLRLSAGLAGRSCRRYGIPVRWLTVADLKNGRRGITSHANVSAAFKKSNHTDPGGDFPVDLYLRWVRDAADARPPKPAGPRVDVLGPKGGVIYPNVTERVALSRLAQLRRRFPQVTLRWRRK